MLAQERNIPGRALHDREGRGGGACLVLETASRPSLPDNQPAPQGREDFRTQGRGLEYGRGNGDNIPVLDRCGPDESSGRS